MDVEKRHQFKSRDSPGRANYVIAPLSCRLSKNEMEKVDSAGKKWRERDGDGNPVTPLLSD